MTRPGEDPRRPIGISAIIASDQVNPSHNEHKISTERHTEAVEIAFENERNALSGRIAIGNAVSTNQPPLSVDMSRPWYTYYRNKDAWVLVAKRSFPNTLTNFCIIFNETVNFVIIGHAKNGNVAS